MFAKRIKYLRQTKEINQVQLSEKLGVAKQSVSNWENDNIMPSVEMLERIADFFGVTTDYLLGRDGKTDTDGTMVDLTGLTARQMEHIKLIIEDFRDA